MSSVGGRALSRSRSGRDLSVTSRTTRRTSSWLQINSRNDRGNRKCELESHSSSNGQGREIHDVQK